MQASIANLHMRMDMSPSMCKGRKQPERHRFLSRRQIPLQMLQYYLLPSLWPSHCASMAIAYTGQKQLLEDSGTHTQWMLYRRGM